MSHQAELRVRSTSTPDDPRARVWGLGEDERPPRALSGFRSAPAPIRLPAAGGTGSYCVHQDVPPESGDDVGDDGPLGKDWYLCQGVDSTLPTNTQRVYPGSRLDAAGRAVRWQTLTLEIQNAVAHNVPTGPIVPAIGDRCRP